MMERIIAQRELAMLNATSKKIKQSDITAGINGGAKELVVPTIIETIQPTFAPIILPKICKKRKQTIKKVVTAVEPATKPIDVEPPKKKSRTKKEPKLIATIMKEIEQEVEKGKTVEEGIKVIEDEMIDLQEALDVFVPTVIPKDIIFCLHVSGDIPNPTEKPECKQFQMNLTGNISRVYEKLLGPLTKEGVDRYLEGSVVMDIVSYKDATSPIGVFYPAGEKMSEDIDFDRRFNRIKAFEPYKKTLVSYGSNYIIWSKDKEVTHDLYKRINAMPLKYPRDCDWLALL